MLVSLVFSAVSIVGVVEKRTYEGTTLNLLLKEGYEIDVIKTYKEEFEKETGIKLNIEVYDEPTTRQKYIFDVTSQTGTYDIPEIDWFLDADPSEISEEHPIINSLQEAYIDVVGEKPIFSGMQGCADMRHLIERGDTPSVLFGPGIIGTAHQANEYVDIDNLLTATKIYAQLILNSCQIA